MASEDHCLACTQWGPESARRAVFSRKTVMVRHTRCTKPADDADATRWPSRVLLLVERRFGGSRASCAMDLIRVDAAGPRNRRFRAVDEQQHCCNCSAACAATPCWQCYQSLFDVAQSDQVVARASSWVRSQALDAYITAAAREKGLASEKFRAIQRRTNLLAT